MKKNVLKFGLISGLLISAFGLASAAFCHNDSTYAQGSMIIGYAAQFLVLSLVFVAVKNYRDKQNDGVITFGKALQMGLYISLIASTMYVLAWLVDYYCFMPDFMDRFSAISIRDIKSSGIPAAEMAQKIAQMEEMRQQYKNPVWVVLYTYMEILPTGLIVTLFTALVLKRKAKGGSAALA